ncbi:MAG TPA: hypothetical protein VGC16_02125 [Rhizomicrobium sp.]
MRVSVLTAGFLLTSAILAMTHLAGPASAHETRVTCLCDCPDDGKLKPRHAAVTPPRRLARRAPRRGYAEGGYYSYGAFGPVVQREWHGAWRAAPNDARIPGPVAYYAPPPDGLHIDERGWTGGVGNGEGGGGGGGGGLGGTVILANGGSAQNGPTYNDYNQSFQQNPSVAGQFQNRLMGGFAPPPSSK